MAIHPALTPGRAAVITGAASGIGLAAAHSLAELGMNLLLADIDGGALEQAAEQIAANTGRPITIRTRRTDVSRADDVAALRDDAYEAWGEVAFLMNNAGVEGGGALSGGLAAWHRIIDTNLWGVVHGVQAFAARMGAQGNAAAIVNTGSKQGITCPPGDTAYNVSKAGIKVVTEALAHDLRQTPGNHVTAHLLIPGATFTGFSRAHGVVEKPAGAWTAEQVAAFMLAGMAAGDFYILCPDHDVTRATDERRIAWAAGDIIHNRPPLSRWHPDHAAAFAEFLKQA